ncbi:uncharacterized protein V6R79_007412 [Siganus canaliculatus]
MAALTSHTEEEMKGGEVEDDVEAEGEEGDEDEKDDVQKQKKAAWTPNIFCRAEKEVHYYAGEKIAIEEGYDSFAGMIWPAALALCHYLDTHRQQPNLVDKAVLEIGSGTGIVSIVAALLGAWVTATDLPVVLGNLRVNLSRNTRGRCRHTPQAAALSWGFDLERTYPASVYRYDYVLAADVVYHHEYLDELLATMKHFCRPGTTLIWANKVRFKTDLKFTENFKEAFHTSMLAEDGDLKIFMATCREEEEGEGGMEKEIQEEEERKEKPDEEEEEEEEEEDEEEGSKEILEEENDHDTMKKEKEIAEEEEPDITVAEEEEEQSCHSSSGGNNTEVQQSKAPTWVTSVHGSLNKDIYRYVGQDILIFESIDHFGAVMWPAALALCSFLDNNRQRVNMQGKEVLELGAGTGLVTIVASLLGASVTATDLPAVLSNLQANVMRNTRGRCRHTPQVAALSWGFDLEHTYPASVYHYDYVLAADVVYHHDYLDELLATMKHFCRPGTTLIWANKVRFKTDLKFTENFKEAFHTSLLAEDGDLKIFMATCRE